MVDADFEGLIVDRVTKTNYDSVKKFLLSDFLYNESLNKSLNLNTEDSNELFSDLVNDGIASSLSYIIRESDSGEIVALRLTTILERPKDEHHIALNDNENGTNGNKTSREANRYCPKAQVIVDILRAMENKVWFYINPLLKRLLLWSIISVRKDYTRRKLAQKLLCYKLDEARQMGFQGCVAEASTIKSQLVFLQQFGPCKTLFQFIQIVVTDKLQLFEKMGYDAIHEVKFHEWLDKRGKQIFQCDDGTSSIKLVFKPL